MGKRSLSGFSCYRSSSPHLEVSSEIEVDGEIEDVEEERQREKVTCCRRSRGDFRSLAQRRTNHKQLRALLLVDKRRTEEKEDRRKGEREREMDGS